MINHKHYTYRVLWSVDDNEHVGLCVEFPSLSFLDKNQTRALEGIVALVREIIKDMEENNEFIPEPLSEKNYSGKFQVRTTPEIHRMLAVQAAENGVSLNRYINSKLHNSD